MLTSGTTARPKVVPLTHGNLLYSASATAAALALAPSDRCLSLAPLVHIHGLTVVLASLTAGASVVCPPEISGLLFFEWLDDYAPTWYVAGPAVHQAILGQAAAHREVITRRPLRLIRSGSAPLPAAVLQGLERSFGAPVLEAYGMTEAAPLISCNPLPPLPRKLNSVGLAAGPRVAIMDDAGALLPTGQVGEVVIQGPNVMAGYQDESANRAAFFSHGWFRTGDQGYLDEEGYLFLTGRLKELISRGGQKIAPHEVDEALLRHPAVAEAVAFAAPHPTLGQEVAAAVVLRPGAQATEGDLRAFVATHLSEPKVPRHILMRDALPRAAGGKLRRVGLAEELGLAAPPPTAAPVRPGDALERRMASLWEMALGVQSVGLHDDFFDLGGSSLLATILVAQIATAFGWRLPLGALRDHGTVAGLSELLRQRQQGYSEPTLVPLQPDGPWPPFFCVPAMDGRVAYYRLLARHLAPDQPVYGLQGRAVPADTTPEQDVGELAAHYVREIRAVQPHGPYYLGGYSAGGWLAYEMARQLHRQGQTVAFLALFDTPCPTLQAPLWRVEDTRPASRARLVYHARVLAGLPPDSRGAYMAGRARALIRQAARVGRRGGRRGASFTAPSAVVQPQWRPYLPGPYAGPVTLFWGSLTRFRPYAGADPRLAWRAIVGSLEIHRAPADHHALMMEPAIVSLVARQVRACLARARAPS